MAHDSRSLPANRSRHVRCGLPGSRECSPNEVGLYGFGDTVRQVPARRRTRILRIALVNRIAIRESCKQLGSCRRSSQMRHDQSNATRSLLVTQSHGLFAVVCGQHAISQDSPASACLSRIESWSSQQIVTVPEIMALGKSLPACAFGTAPPWRGDTRGKRCHDRYDNVNESPMLLHDSIDVARPSPCLAALLRS